MINDGRAYSSLSYLFKGSAKEKYNSVRTIGDANDEGCFTGWPESIQYLLPTYVTSGSILEGILRMRDTRQREKYI